MTDKLTPSQRAELIRNYGIGAHIDVAAAAAGIRRTTLRDAMLADKGLRDDLAEARLEAAAESMSVIRQAADAGKKGAAAALRRSRRMEDTDDVRAAAEEEIDSFAAEV